MCSVYNNTTYFNQNMAVKLTIESGVQLLARLTKRPNIKKFYPALFPDGPTHGDLIEIFSDTCTSYFLIDVISELLINTKLNDVPPEILIFDTDGNLNYDELINVVTKKIWTASSDTHNTDSGNVGLKREVEKTMARLHILNIYDATQFNTTIYNLENALVEHPNISMIIFNTLTAFYWSEQGFKITKMDLYTKNLINRIQKVTKEYKIICMYTRPEYFCTNKESDSQRMEVNYQIQLLDNDKENYQVNIKSSYNNNMNVTKFFRIVDGSLKWVL